MKSAYLSVNSYQAVFIPKYSSKIFGKGVDGCLPPSFDYHVRSIMDVILKVV